MTRRKNQRFAINGRVPFGYDDAGYKLDGNKVHRKLKENRTEQTIIRLIQRLRGDGMKIGTIMTTLNMRGDTTKNGKPWGWSQVNDILERPKKINL